MPATPVTYDDLVAVLAPGTGPADNEDGVLLQLAEQVARAAPPDRAALRTAVRALARLLERRAPGRTVEVRVPPFVAVQCVPGPRHTRGTPPNVVEAEPQAFVQLCTGALGWQEAAADGRLRASGDRAQQVAELLPLLPAGCSGRKQPTRRADERRADPPIDALKQV